MIPVLAACLLEAQIVRRRAWITDAILLAAIVTALFYLKITFAVVAMGTLLLAAICIPQNRLSCVLAIFLTVIAIGLIALSGPSLVGYLNDLHRASLAAPFAGQNYDPFRLLKLKENLTQEWFNLLAPVCFAVWLGRTSTTLAERDSANRILLLCMIASAGSIALGWQNHEHSMPSQIVAMAISFAAIRRRQIARDHANRSTQSLPSNWPPVVFAGCIFAFMACVSILDNGRSVIIHTIKTALDIGQPVATLSPNLQGLIVPNDNKPGVILDILAGKIDPALYSEKSKTNWHNDVAKILDNGWELFQAHQPRNPRIATIFSAPIMTSLTGTVPPRHMAAWMDVERTVGPRSPVIPERDLADTNVVMVFKLYDHELIFDMIKVYLGANFHIAGETPIWQMWVRNGDQ